MNNSKVPEKILVALDGSVIAGNAADIAVQIAEANHLEIMGLYIIDEPFIFDPYADHSKELGRDPGSVSRATLIKWYGEVGSFALGQLQDACAQKGIPVKTEIVLGDVPDLILKNAKQAAYIALGRRGKSHVSSPAHLGRNFQRIAHHANVPLIVGGDEARYIHQVLLVYTGSKNEDLFPTQIINLQQTSLPEVIAGMKELSNAESNPETFRNRITKQGLNTEKIEDLRVGSIEDILNVSIHNEVDLIIMRGFQHQGILSFTMGSLVEQVLRQTTLPVLIL